MTDKAAKQYYEKLTEIGITLSIMRLPPAFDKQTALINIDLESMLRKLRLAVSGGKQHIDLHYPNTMENNDGRPTR